MRIGIGGERKGDLADYVISGFRKEDRKTVEDSILRAADAVICTVEKGIDIAMGEYNTKAKKKSAQEKKPERESAEIRDPDRRSAEEDAANRLSAAQRQEAECPAQKKTAENHAEESL